MCRLLGTRQEKFARSDVLALVHNTKELTRVTRQIEKDYAYVYHGFTSLDDDRMRARNHSFEICFARLDGVLRRLDKHIEAIERNAG